MRFSGRWWVEVEISQKAFRKSAAQQTKYTAVHAYPSEPKHLKLSENTVTVLRTSLRTLQTPHNLIQPYVSDARLLDLQHGQLRHLLHLLYITGLIVDAAHWPQQHVSSTEPPQITHTAAKVLCNNVAAFAVVAGKSGGTSRPMEVVAFQLYRGFSGSANEDPRIKQYLMEGMRLVPEETKATAETAWRAAVTPPTDQHVWRPVNGLWKPLIAYQRRRFVALLPLWSGVPLARATSGPGRRALVPETAILAGEDMG